MLVVFKSAPILKRTLKVKHAMLQVILRSLSLIIIILAFQLYVLKLLKMQTKYLGRQWRKSNMKTMSAIYTKVPSEKLCILSIYNNHLSRYGTGSTMTGPLAMTWTPDRGISRHIKFYSLICLFMNHDELNSIHN